MRIVKVSLSFMQLSDPGLETKANFIATSLKGNLNFPTPTPPLADLVNAITDYSTSLQGAATRDRVQIKIKIAKKLALNNLLRSLANYVSFVSNGDEAIIASSGFDATKQAGTSGPVLPPENSNATIGINAGEAVSSCSGGSGIKIFNHQCAPDPVTSASVWTNNFNKRTFTFKGLESGKKYWFRIQVIGKNGEVANTDPIAVIIQ
jgi:hypothetical protein